MKYLKSTGPVWEKLSDNKVNYFGDKIMPK
jgi:hypothetical protein